MAGPFSPNPNIFMNPAIQPRDMPLWSAAGTYNWGDCVTGSDGFSYCLLAATSSGPGYPYVGLTSDPTIPGFSLSLKYQNGIDMGGEFSYDTPAYLAAPLNPNGAQWVNLTLLSPRVPPWNENTQYNVGDLVYFPTDQPTVVWRLNTPVPAGNAPNVPGLNQTVSNQVNQWWGLISNPLQQTAFNPSVPYVYGTNVEVFVNQPLPAIRPAPL